MGNHVVESKIKFFPTNYQHYTAIDDNYCVNELSFDPKIHNFYTTSPHDRYDIAGICIVDSSNSEVNLIEYRLAVFKDSNLGSSPFVFLGTYLLHPLHIDKFIRVFQFKTAFRETFVLIEHIGLYDRNNHCVIKSINPYV